MPAPIRTTSALIEIVQSLSAWPASWNGGAISGSGRTFQASRTHVSTAANSDA
jgi:hypothetical protein